MARINSKQKGKRGELEWAAHLRGYGIEARRGQQFSGTEDSPDVVTSLDHLLYWEVKRDKSRQLMQWLTKAQSEAPEGAMAIVAHRRDRENWKVTFDTSHPFASGFLAAMERAGHRVAPKQTPLVDLDLMLEFYGMVWYSRSKRRLITAYARNLLPVLKEIADAS